MTTDQKRGRALSGGRDSETMEEKQAAESTQTVVVEDREGLARYQQFKWSLIFIGFVLSSGVGYLLYSFLLPGISYYFQIILWLASAICFVAAAVFTWELLNEFGWSVPKIGEPNKPETGAELC